MESNEFPLGERNKFGIRRTNAVLIDAPFASGNLLIVFNVKVALFVVCLIELR